MRQQHCWSSFTFRPGAPNLGYMYPQGYISLSEGVRLGLAIEEKSIFICYLFPDIYTYINEIRWWSLETWSRSRDPFFEVSVSKVSGLVSVSVSKHLGLELFVSRLCIGYFSRSRRSVAKLSLLLCCLRDGENNLPSTPFKIYTEFNKKCARTNDTAARNLCNERLGVLC